MPITFLSPLTLGSRVLQFIDNTTDLIHACRCSQTSWLEFMFEAQALHTLSLQALYTISLVVLYSCSVIRIHITYACVLITRNLSQYSTVLIHCMTSFSVHIYFTVAMLACFNVHALLTVLIMGEKHFHHCYEAMQLLSVHC